MPKEQPEKGTQSGVPPSEPKSIKIGDKEYNPDKLNDLVKKGELASQIEQEQNIDIKELYPEFTRRSQTLKEYEEGDEFEDEDLEGEDYEDLEEGVDLYENPYPDKVNQRLSEIEKKVALLDKRDEQIAIKEIKAETKELKKANPGLNEQELWRFAKNHPNLSLEDAYSLIQLKKEQAEKRDKELKAKTQGLEPGGASLTRGIRDYDPKKSREENLDEAEEDFNKFSK